MPVASTCCGKGQGQCVCGMHFQITQMLLPVESELMNSLATQAKCSCGQKAALACSCDKASTENAVSGPRCSCRTSSPALQFSFQMLTVTVGARPAGACTCDRADTENTLSSTASSLCSCGARPAGTLHCPLQSLSIDTNHYRCLHLRERL
jgi:hypothetical protein